MAPIRNTVCVGCGQVSYMRLCGLCEEAQKQEIPKAISSATFKLFGVDVKCYVLDNGKRIIDESSIAALMEAMAAAPTVASVPVTCPGDSPDIEVFAKWQRGDIN